MSLMQPIYEGSTKSKADQASESYCGIYLSSALAKLSEGILMSRLTKFIGTLSTLIKNQPGTQPGRHIHDATYCLLRLSIIQYNISQNGLATYVAFCDFSTAFPSIYPGPGKFLLLLCMENIVAECGSISGPVGKQQVVKVRSYTHGSPKTAALTSCVGYLRVAG